MDRRRRGQLGGLQMTVGERSTVAVGSGPDEWFPVGKRDGHPPAVGRGWPLPSAQGLSQRLDLSQAVGLPEDPFELEMVIPRPQAGAGHSSRCRVSRISSMSR